MKPGQLLIWVLVNLFVLIFTSPGYVGWGLKSHFWIVNLFKLGTEKVVPDLAKVRNFSSKMRWVLLVLHNLALLIFFLAGKVNR